MAEMKLLLVKYSSCQCYPLRRSFPETIRKPNMASYLGVLRFDAKPQAGYPGAN